MFKTGKDVWSTDACIFILSYDLASKRSNEIEKRSFACSIADEAHYLKSRDAKRSQVLIPILMKSKRTILISGTPILSKPVELYNLMKAVRPDLIPSFN
jgi:SWI/SNF-related matrix-associated actin-dependent regulator 1 of chromatin subfamily A